MTVERLRYPEWRREWAETRYPFSDAATLTNGKVFLPEGAFLDASLHLIGATAPIWLTAVDVTAAAVTFFVGDVQNRRRASATWLPDNPPEMLAFVDEYQRPAGVLLTRPAVLSVLATWEKTTHLFEAKQTEFAAACCVSLPEPGVRGFVTDDGEVFTGDVWLVGGPGVTLSVDSFVEPRLPSAGGDQTVAAIRVDVVGDPLFKRAQCGEAAVAKNYLQRLLIQSGCHCTHCRPDANGDFKLTAATVDEEGKPLQTVLRIRVKDGKLHIGVVGDRLQDVR